MTRIDSNPFPLGFVTCVPGTPARLTMNYPDLEIDDSCNLILLQSDSENKGRCFFGNHRLNILTGEGLIYTMGSPNDSFVLYNSAAQNVYKVSDFRIDVEFPGDGVRVSVYIR
jgi:hypothetical protein